ncbi:tryptophan-rich antigen [Plasmodium gonderi]|uniref:Tryptophan-rich antigen n=1 Tax=Plasmodium gonderi TaxID=77519 RepID=A0A1Y1JFH3_PLAGO|nr:tryptophan-rich antigen [Plasmodium gonderi]GAW80085.1 tryptophan-rich antigen [Plasmodium gonderi]
MNAKILSPLFFIVLIEVLLSQRCSGNPKWMEHFKYEDNYYNNQTLEAIHKRLPLRVYFDQVNENHQYRNRLWRDWFNTHKEKITADLNNVAEKSIQNLEKGWEDFVKETEHNKWLHYNDDMKKEYKCTVYPQALKWGVTRWISWFKDKGLVCLKQDLHKFLSKCRKEHQLEMKVVLQKWHKVYLNEWCNQPWKLRENYHCKKWEKFGLMGDPYYNVKSYQWNSWMERTKCEHKQWVDNLRDLEKNCPTWNEWKKGKCYFYKSWLKEFTKQWIANEQWNTWTEERKKHILSQAGKTKPAQKKTVQKK